MRHLLVVLLFSVRFDLCPCGTSQRDLHFCVTTSVWVTSSRFNDQSKIPTPAIDRLATEGMRFSDAIRFRRLHADTYGIPVWSVSLAHAFAERCAGRLESAFDSR